MTLQQMETKIKEIELEIAKLNKQTDKDSENKKQELLKERDQLLKSNYLNRSAYDQVQLARHPDRPNVKEYIQALFNDFIELHGDRQYRDDPSIIGGIAMFNNQPVTIIGNMKGKNVEENLKYNFGMAHPEGYRKALRLMKQADKFQRPIITFIDTPGAYPGIGAEKRGQGEAIARNIMEMFSLSVPIISIVIGEGGSGGALALSVANRIIMLENSIYSILSPEGFASILYKDSSQASKASEQMKLTAKDLYELNIIDDIIQEPLGGIHYNKEYVYLQLKHLLEKELTLLNKKKKQELLDERYQKFRKIGDKL